MKKITLFLLLSMVIVFGAEAHKHRKAQVTISIQTFYDQLSPYGDWIYTPDYGYVWRPYFDNPASFRPYSSNGNWVYTDYGWTWASGYDWGWATFHYGRWDFDNYLGWTWIPGYEWAPAWVSWGSYDNYYGWAPMGPNIYVHSNWFAPDPWWTFVPRNRFCSVHWNRYIYHRPVHVTHITHITNVYVNSNNHNNHNSWYNGPQVNEVERYNRGKVRRVEVVDSERPERAGVKNNRLSVYRPAVENSRKDSRPGEYRNVEQARTGKRIEQTTARANDPGVNRNRETRTETRSDTRISEDRNVNTSMEKRTDARTSAQIPTSRSSDATRETRETPRATPQSGQRNSSATRETRIEPGTGSQATTERNSTRPSAELKKKTSDSEGNIRITEGNRTSANPSRIENSENRQTRTNAPTRENSTSNSSRKSGNRETTSAQTTREQRTHDAAPASHSRTENTESKKTTKEQVKEAVRKSAEDTPIRESSGNSKRR